ncbi:non-heme iron oxygenase ferredoxin subunit [Polaromonas aquatica]|jgi:nitrite reductase/ring-hydroxylating ferredoxin subunit|uniref:Non-heme iron oxygenase ferredoxin subunit n=1 Tax=Polaromonas aquatica TaxID=332657 RepID=A0ABW1TT93_9BURK
MNNDWIKAAEVSEVESDGTFGVELGGQEICLYKLDDGIYATDGKCTHGDAYLAQGFIVEGSLIECPLHEGTFDIKTGAPTGAPCSVALKCHKVKVTDGVIYIHLDR